MLASLDAEPELYADRETIASVIRALPSAPLDQWYDRTIPPGETHEGKTRQLFDWLEKERKSAVLKHLDGMADQTEPAHRSSVQTCVVFWSLYGPRVVGWDLCYPGGGAVGKEEPAQRGPKLPAGGPRGDVTTQLQAQEIADKRLATLVGKNLDKCPLCSAHHTYDKVWTSATPAVSAKMTSTHLLSCPKFVAMSGEKKAETVNTQAACLHCTAWDHIRHCLPGGKEIGDPKCKIKIAGVECGMKHGKWFHAGTVAANTNTTIVSPATTLHIRGTQPALYEVYNVALAGTQGEKRNAMTLVDPGSDTGFHSTRSGPGTGTGGCPSTLLHASGKETSVAHSRLVITRWRSEITRESPTLSKP